jgi:hypothetical protein
MNPELQKYASNARQRGMNDEQIRAELVKAGWSEENINQVIPPQVPVQASPQAVPPTPQTPQQVTQFTPATAQITSKPKKDYWNICKRNFRAMGIASFLFVILFGLTLLDSSNSGVKVLTKLASIVAFFFITGILFLVIASMFKGHSQKAVMVAYLYLAVSTIFTLVNYLVLSSPSEFTNGITTKILSFVVLIYLFFTVYKASKQSLAQQ